MDKKKQDLLEEMADLVAELIGDADFSEGNKTVYLSQEVLADLWEVNEEYSEFILQGAQIQ